jgi:hypothetical protein
LWLVGGGVVLWLVAVVVFVVVVMKSTCVDRELLQFTSIANSNSSFTCNKCFLWNV